MVSCRMPVIVYQQAVQIINCGTFEVSLICPVLCIFYAISGFLLQ
jgi:hypothetical protein